MRNVVLITGTSSGFGLDAAQRLARRGHHVIATMRDSRGRNAAARASLERLASDEELALTVVELDVTDDASVTAAVDAALREAGRIDVVINNAGYAGLGVTEAYTVEQWQRMFDVNVFGVVRVNRAVLPIMRKQRSGLLIHVSSAAGRVAIPAMAAYCSSKFALEALADTYRFELLPFGIDSVLVEPGIYRTPIFDRTAAPDDRSRVADYGADAEFADRVTSVFQAAIGAPDNGGSAEVAEALVRLVEMDSSERPFRTIVGEAIKPLFEPYNAAAEGMRPVIAQIFAVPELAGSLADTATA
jgi:NAD(P)-dependent dehydrogenase (short-subunit alcohol dehydrogenase family)